MKLLPTPLAPWLDKFGLVTYAGIDGGDTCANEFTVAYCLHQANLSQIRPTEPVLQQLYANKVPVRHPDPHMWYSDQDRLSRDQFTPLLIYLAVVGGSYFWRLFKLHASRGFCFTWNTKRNFVYNSLALHLERSTPDVPHRPEFKLPDVTLADIWAVWVRGLLMRLPRVARLMALTALQPVLSVLDLHTLLSVAYVRSRLVLGYTVSADRRNLTLKVHFGANYCPTLVSKLASQIYGKELPMDFAHVFWTQVNEPPIHTYIRLLY